MNVQGRTATHAVAQALFVTFLWSTSWVLIKFGLAELPALTFAGLRYMLALLILLPLAVRPSMRPAWSSVTRQQWGLLVALGVIYYAVTQGTQFVALAYLPAMTVSLLLNFTSVLVALAGVAWLGERLRPHQWAGIALNLVGVLVYFRPASLPAGAWFGVGVALLGVAANAASALLGRRVNRDGSLPPVLVTAAGMAVGAPLLLGAGAALQGVPELTWRAWALIGWLAVVNTALAFTLWNQSLAALTAVQASLINSTMLVQIALLAWVFLGERIDAVEGIGLALAALGVALVQVPAWPAALRRFGRAGLQ